MDAGKTGGILTGYREYRFYSFEHDSEAARLSMVDDRGREYYRIVPTDRGRRWREVRDQALSEIEDAIMAGNPPGEVGDRGRAYSSGAGRLCP